MKAATIVLITALAVFCLPAAVVGDWDPDDGHKMHFPQLPDLQNGLDVLAGPSLHPFITGEDVPEKFLADDWRCSATGPVTDIHLWGSYLDDELIFDDPAQTFFSLVIYDNIADGPNGYSIPGDPLWDTYTQPIAARLYETADEEFYDPNEGRIVGTDTQVWQFNFEIPEDAAFIQRQGEVYWLGVHHTFDVTGDGTVDVADFNTLNNIKPVGFGWKTSRDEFMDDAVWVDVNTFANDPHVVPGAVTPWNELFYPDGHPYFPDSMHLSFVITPEPASLGLLAVGGVLLALYRRR